MRNERDPIMSKKIPRITNSEKEILEVLWESETPLTSTELVDASKERSWKPSSAHLLLNSLLKKEMIQVAGFKRTTKNYARTFAPAMTREEFSIRQLRQEQKITGRALSKLFTAFVEEEDDPEVLAELTRMLEERKRELAQEGGAGEDC